MKLCDLTVEEYLGITQVWGTGVWILFTAATLAAAWIWKRWRKKKLSVEPELIPVEFPECHALDESSGARCHLLPDHPPPHVGPKIIVWDA